VRLGFGIGRFTDLELHFGQSLERIEPEVGVGARFRPFYSPRFSPYVHAEVSMVGVTKIGSNYDLLEGVGGFFRVCRFFAAFAEVEAVERVGELNMLNLRFELGLAFTTPSFWRM
jgi:hypothetical protein